MPGGLEYLLWKHEEMDLRELSVAQSPTNSTQVDDFIPGSIRAGVGVTRSEEV